MTGGKGHDHYIVDSINDSTIEIATTLWDTDIDSVESSISWTLVENIENLTLTTSEAINATGNSLSNEIHGNTANNILLGNAGDDTLFGESGADSLSGEAGNDLIFSGGNPTGQGDNTRDTIKISANSGNDTIISGYTTSTTTADIIDMSETLKSNITYQHNGADLLITSKESTGSVTVIDFYTYQEDHMYTVSSILCAQGATLDLTVI